MHLVHDFHTTYKNNVRTPTTLISRAGKSSIEPSLAFGIPPDFFNRSKNNQGN